MLKKVILGTSAATAAVAIGFVVLQSDLHARSNPDDIAAAKRWNNKIISEGISVPSRLSHLSVLSGTSSESPLDLLIIGGGASGCGCALDAATRGLKVGLVERDDFSSGTSSRSTKLVHGGVRYLQKAVFHMDLNQLKLVFQALDERHHMLRSAPHLCTTLPTMTPCYELWEIPYYWSGLKLYDLVAGRQLLHLSRFYSAKQSKDLFPTLSQNDHGRSLKGAVVYYDGQFDDSRFNVMLACTAALAGAAVLNHAEVVALYKDDISGRVTCARVRNHLTGKEFDVHAKLIINAAGPFCDEVRKLADKEASALISPSSGVHIVLPDYYSPDGMGLIVPKTKDGRVIFMLPWLGRTIAGTTDSSTEITMFPEPKEEEIEFILDAISDYLCVQVRRADVLSAWSGIRPLASKSSVINTENISREHIIYPGPDGLLTITGGKWTTYRSMSEDAVNTAMKLGNFNSLNGCVTKHLTLMGGDDWDPALFAILSQKYIRMKRSSSGKIVPGAFGTAVAKHLSRSYGSYCHQVAAIAQDENLGKRLAHGYPYLEAEVAYCARNEYCETAVDFIARRSRLAFLDTNAASKAMPRVIEILGAEHSWDRSRKKLELEKAKAFLKTFKSSQNAVVTR